MTDLDTLARGHAEVIRETASRHSVPPPETVRHGAPQGPNRLRWLVPALAGIACLLILALTGLIRFPTDDPVDEATTLPSTIPTSAATSVPTPGPLLGNAKIVLGGSEQLLRVFTLPGSIETPALAGLSGMHVQTITWSPDGQHMAAIDPFGNLVVFDPITGTVVAEVDSVGAMECFCDIDWSPDRSTIAVANDQGTVSLIDTTGWNVEILEIEGDDGMRVGSPTWSPDSEWLAFTYRRPSGVNHGVSGVAKVRPSGEDLTILLEGSDVSSIDWSPIFKEIAGLVLEPLRGSDPRALEVILIDADGAGHETLTEAGECFCIGYQPGIGWSPDGTMLALNVPLAEPSTSSLWTISRDGSGLVQVPFASGAGDPAWQPAAPSPPG
jgi:hypothetical protein